MIAELMNEVVSYERYENNELFYIDKDGKDFSVKDTLSFSEWLIKKDNFPTIKVEGIETNAFITSNFPRIDFNTVHLFVQNKKGYSFGWHKDDTNVYLYVVKGRKKVFIDDEQHWVGFGDGIHILKGNKHKVESDNDTWALSLGYE
jgi:mannose-6-phosphate isomerase-like protein (cupin superfamily)